MSTSNQNTLTYLSALLRAGYWGNVNLKIQHGEVIQFVKEESIKPAELVTPSTNLTPNTEKLHANFNHR